MKRPVTPAHVLEMARLHHILFALSGLYFGQYSGTWRGTARRGWYAWSDGEGNQATLAWDRGGLVGIVFDHESSRSEYGLDEDERQPLRRLRGLPESLRALATKTAADFENLVTAGFWSVGDSVKFSDPLKDRGVTHGLSLVAGFVLSPEEAVFGETLLQSWLELSSLDEGHARLALRLASSPRSAISREDGKQLLALPDGVETIELANARQTKADLAAVGISWTIPHAGIRALAQARQREHASRIEGAMSAETRALFEAVRSQDARRVSQLLRKGADLDARTVEGQWKWTPAGDTPLIQACKAKAESCALALLRAGADVHATNQYGQDALTWAARTRLQKVAKACLASGADATHRDHSGETALLWAAQEGDEPLVDALLAAGARPGVKTHSGVTAADRAGMHGHHALAARLRALE